MAHAPPRLRLAILVIALALAGFVGARAFAAFTSTDNGQQSVGSGTLQINLGGLNFEDDEFTLDATNVVPGDFIVRTLQVSVTGSVDATAIELESTATTSSILDSDATNPLTMGVYYCSVPFDQVLVNGTYPFVTGCSGNVAVEYTGPAVFAKQVLPDVPVTPGTLSYLAFVMQMPDAAVDPQFMGQHSVLQLRFTADQRAGAFK